MLKPHNSPRAEEVKAERGQVPGLSELVGAFQIHAGGQVTSSEGPSGSPSPHPVKGSCILPCCSAALGSSRARRSGCPEGSWHRAHFLLGGGGGWGRGEDWPCGRIGGICWPWPTQPSLGWGGPHLGFSLVVILRHICFLLEWG